MTNSAYGAPVAGVGSVTGVLLADVGSANQGTAPLATRGWDRPGDGMNIWICCFGGHDTPVEKNTLPNVGDLNQGLLLVQFHMSMCTIQDFKLSKCKPVRFHQGSMFALPLLPDCR